MEDARAVADELYGLPPEEFTPARNGYARRAKADGDRALAEQIGRFAKPAVSARLVNLLVRRDRDQIDEALAVGDELRQANADLDDTALRALTARRQQLLAGLTATVRALAAELGQPLPDATLRDVQETLQAAFIDAGAAAAVRTGLLTKPLTATGLDPVDITQSVAIVPEVAPAPRRADGSPRVGDRREAVGGRGRTATAGAGGAGGAAGHHAARRGTGTDAAAARRALEKARAEAEAAERAAAEASAVVERLDARVANALDERDDLTHELGELADRIEVLRRTLADLDRETAQLRTERTRARKALNDAEREERRAQARLARAEDGGGDGAPHSSAH
jgi:DNA repair exonuclease SbcCD ATPase subunit